MEEQEPEIRNIHNSSGIIIQNIETWIPGPCISDESVIVKQYKISDEYHTKFKW